MNELVIMNRKQNIGDTITIQEKVISFLIVCFLQVLFGQSCKTFLDIVACPNWTKLQSVGQS